MWQSGLAAWLWSAPCQPYRNHSRVCGRVGQYDIAGSREVAERAREAPCALFEGKLVVATKLETVFGDLDVHDVGSVGCAFATVVEPVPAGGVLARVSARVALEITSGESSSQRRASHRNRLRARAPAQSSRVAT